MYPQLSRDFKGKHNFLFIEDFLLLQQFDSFKNMSTNSSKLFSLQETKFNSHLLECRRDLGTHFWRLKYGKSDGLSPKTAASILGRILSLARSLNQITCFVGTGFHLLTTFRQPMETPTCRETAESNQQPCEWACLEMVLLPEETKLTADPSDRLSASSWDTLSQNHWAKPTWIPHPHTLCEIINVLSR